MKCRAAVLVSTLMCIVFFSSCKKYEDKPGASDDRLSKPYCNDPNAVNYNWGFPGTPDNTTCIYPSEAFQGDWLYTDSVYNNNVLVQQSVNNISLTAMTKTELTLSGMCSNGNTLRLVASRKLRADVDTVVGAGQLFCRNQDTVVGYITRNGIDGELKFEFTVNSDTGIYIHRGSALKK